MFNEYSDKSHNLGQRRFSISTQALSEIPSEIIIKTRIKYGTTRSASKALLAEYSKKSSIHGLNYIFEIHRPLYERLCWIICILISLYLAVTFMWATYMKWLDSPIILGLDETLVPIHKIPFPTVTICPETKTDDDFFSFDELSVRIWAEIEVFDDFKNRVQLTDKELKYFLATLQTCEKDVIDSFLPYMKNHDTFNSVNVTQSLNDVKPEKSSIIPSCAWNGRSYSNCSILKTIATAEGICYQFNGLNTNDLYKNPKYINNYEKDEEREEDEEFNNKTGYWSLDDGYVGQGSNAYPKRSIKPSAQNGFHTFLRSELQNFQWVCRGYRPRYKVFLNSPEDVHLRTGNYILVPFKQNIEIIIYPQYVKSDENILSFGPETRQCYFNSERDLSFFKFYTQNNCQTECLSNHTVKRCGCAEFWMPRPVDIRDCDLLDVECYTDAAKELEFILEKDIKRKMTNSTIQILCDCLPACNSLDYNFVLIRNKFDLDAVAAAYRDTLDDEGVYSFLSLYYSETQFTAIKRHAMYSGTQLIASLGSILALFMGVSALSLIEFIYFFSIRLFYNLRKRRYIKSKLLRLEINALK